MKTPWYHFWNPMSGLPGGVLAAAVLAVISLLVAWLVQA